MDFTVSEKQTRTLMNIKSEKQHIFRKQYLFYDRSKWNEHKRILKEVVHLAKISVCEFSWTFYGVFMLSYSF